MLTVINMVTGRKFYATKYLRNTDLVLFVGFYDNLEGTRLERRILWVFSIVMGSLFILLSHIFQNYSHIVNGVYWAGSFGNRWPFFWLAHKTESVINRASPHQHSVAMVSCLTRVHYRCFFPGTALTSDTQYGCWLKCLPIVVILAGNKYSLSRDMGESKDSSSCAWGSILIVMGKYTLKRWRTAAMNQETVSTLGCLPTPQRSTM
jgi:hypothetical protein